MRETKAILEETRRDLGIHYRTYHLFEINEKNIKRVTSKNDNYLISDSDLLEDEMQFTYQYEETYDEVEIQEDAIYIQGYYIGKLKPNIIKLLLDKEYEFILYGGNQKRIIYKDDDPYKIKIIHSNDFYARVEIKS